MADSFTMTPTINDPVQVVTDMALSLERVVALLANTNSDLMEFVVERLAGGDDKAVHRIASNIWCMNEVAIEKLEEIQLLLGEVETPLRALSFTKES